MESRILELLEDNKGSLNENQIWTNLLLQEDLESINKRKFADYINEINYTLGVLEQASKIRVFQHWFQGRLRKIYATTK